MNPLYDLGYQTIKDPNLLVQVAGVLDAVVLDVRLRAASRDPKWNKVFLQRKLLERYVHIPDLGNLNYKDWSAPIQIKDLAAGLRHIDLYLQANPVILLCACRDRKTCHRLEIVKACQHTLSAHTPTPRCLAIDSVSLDLAACRKIIDNAPEATQGRLFQ